MESRTPQDKPASAPQRSNARRSRLRKIGMFTLSGSVVLLLLRAWAGQSEPTTPESLAQSSAQPTAALPPPPPEVADRMPAQEMEEDLVEDEMGPPDGSDSAQEEELPVEAEVEPDGIIGGTGDTGDSNGRGIGGKVTGTGVRHKGAEHAAIPGGVVGGMVGRGRAPRVRQGRPITKRKARVWGGIKGGIAAGMMGGNIRSGRLSMAATSGQFRVNAAHPVNANKLISTKETKFATISTDVDTASYARMRSKVIDSRWISPENVRVEEYINYFDYNIPDSQGEHPIGIVTETAPAPWNPDRVLMRVGVKAKANAESLDARKNLVFLLDVSGSMMGSAGLDLVKFGLTQLLETLHSEDRVAIVVYAGASGVVLAPTKVANKSKILRALHRLEAGGSTNGGAGMDLAYKLARKHFVKGGINRVILATDGDFNVGIRGQGRLTDYIEKKRKHGIYLSVLGFSAGDSSDRTMEQLADHGNGNYAYIDSRREAKRALLAQAKGTLSPVADDVKIQVEFDPKLVAGHQVVGYKNRTLAKRDFMDDKKDAGDMGAGQSATALYELELTPAAKQNPSASLAKIAVRYRPFGKKKHEMFKVEQSGIKDSLDDASDDFRFTAAVAQFAQVLENKAPDRTLSQTHRLIMNARGEDRDCARGEFAELVKAYACGAIGADASEWSEVHGCGLGELRDELSQCNRVAGSRPKPEPVPAPEVTSPEPEPEPASAMEPAEEESSSPFEHLAAFFELLASLLRALPRWAALVPAALGLGLWAGNRSSDANR